METNREAVACRASCHLIGYFEDPFALWFCNKSSSSPSSRIKRQPLTNLGTWIRTAYLDEQVCNFISLHPTVQVINLGAGFDTRFWRLQQHHSLKLGQLRWFEVDLEFVLKEKQRILQKNKCSTECITFISQDLNSDFEVNFDKHFDKSIPTLVLAECLFPYLQPKNGDSLVKYFESFCFCEMLAFEILIGHQSDDSFGKMMIANMENHFQVEIPGVEKYPTLESLKARFSNWIDIKTFSLFQLWETWKKANVFEFIDDVQELKLMFEHFGVFQAKFLHSISRKRAWQQISQ